ncbi:MAG TPA: transposase [Cyclobacteriaceae bacterium]|nr:transposase [Cyclobacteriaceae bacterium]
MSEDILKSFRKSHIEIGKIYFWTATINGWQSLLEQDRYKQVVVDSLSYLSEKRKIDVFAFVIMPNHIHLIWRINEPNGKELPHHSFLKYTAHQFEEMLRNESVELTSYKVRAENKAYEFWRRDSLAVELYTEHVAYQKLDYIHANPTSGRWMLVNDPIDYKYSSIKFYEQDVKAFPFLVDLRNEF